MPEPEIITRSPAKLIPIKQKLDESPPAHPRGEHAPHHVKNNKVVVLSAAPQETEEIIQTVGVDTAMVTDRHPHTAGHGRGSTG